MKDFGFPEFLIIPPELVSTPPTMAMIVYAFMHCTAFSDGDVEFTRNQEPLQVVKRSNFPNSITEFINFYQRIGADGFHARCISEEMSPSLKQMGPHPYALISASYNFMSTMMCGNEAKAFFHPSLDANKQNYKRIYKETLDGFISLLDKKELPPIKMKK